MHQKSKSLYLPLIITLSLIGSGCEPDNTRQNAQAVGALSVGPTAQETAYTAYAGFFVFKLQADAIRPKITPESPQGENLLNLVCQN